MAKRKQYSDNDKAAALAALDANGGNVYRTAKELGVGESTLRGWAGGRGTNAGIADLREVKKKGLADKLEDVAHAYTDHLLQQDTIYKTPAKDAAITVGTAIDKMRLLRGLPTEIIELIPGVLIAIEKLGQRPSDVFQRIIERAAQLDG